MSRPERRIGGGIDDGVLGEGTGVLFRGSHEATPIETRRVRLVARYRVLIAMPGCSRCARSRRDITLSLPVAATWAK